jgi:hypothetical protein
MRAHDHIGDLPPAGDEQADLAVELTGELGQRPGQFVGDDPLGRETPPVELADPLDLCRSEAGEVAVYSFYGRSLLTATYKGRMRRCASSFVIAAYAKVRLIPQDSRALPAPFVRSHLGLIT